MQPKILIFDIETSPNVAYIWNKYEQDALGDFIHERKIISVAWKWFGKAKVESMSIPEFYGYRNPELKNKKLIEKLHSLFCSADVLVAQNGDSFDIKMANAEFVQYGMKPVPKLKTVDTLKVARNKFRFNSNKLDDLGKRLGLGRKMKTGGFQLWVDCLRGSKKAWDKMVKYNKQDVVLLEKIYIKLRPWMTNHPNMNVFDGAQGCPVCRSNKIQARGYGMTVHGRRRRYQCQNCGHWCRGKYETAGLMLE